MADKIRKIVSPEGIKEAKNELAHLFRMICWELGIGPNEWEYKLRKYLELTEASIPRNAKDRSYARGNLNAQLMDKKMTWTTFMRGLKFLGVTKINFAVSLTHPSGKVTEHRMGIRTRLTAEDLSLAETEVSLPRTPKARYVATLEQASGETTRTCLSTTSPIWNRNWQTSRRCLARSLSRRTIQLMPLPSWVRRRWPRTIFAKPLTRRCRNDGMRRKLPAVNSHALPPLREGGLYARLFFSLVKPMTFTLDGYAHVFAGYQYNSR
jgi:hypothetical protein